MVGEAAAGVKSVELQTQSRGGGAGNIPGRTENTTEQSPPGR